MSTENNHGSSGRAQFSGNIGYVLAVAGSAVGLGNIWRFPYLAAEYGGGMFLLTYLLLVFSFGFALVVSETTLGRMTRKSAVSAYQSFGKSFPIKFGGWINAIVPMLIVPYYCVIGGWVIKYFFEYCVGNSTAMAADGFFGAFITNSPTVEFWFVCFAMTTFLAVFAGVKHGVELVSKVMMPALILMAIVITIYSITRPGALEGVQYLFVPDFANFSWKTVVAAMGQMFFSLSIAMGILVTYGSYMKADTNIVKATCQLGLVDTIVATLAASMIIPAVFAFSGGSLETLQAGPSLMFIMLPKVFESMGISNIIGGAFFLMVLFAALTSSISLMETCVSTFMDELKVGRKTACFMILGISLVLGTASGYGYGDWSHITIFGMAVLDFLDFTTNSVMMPLAALCTCIFVLKVVKIDGIAKEILKSADSFSGRSYYAFILRFVAPICLFIIMASSIASMLGLIKF